MSMNSHVILTFFRRLHVLNLQSNEIPAVDKNIKLFRELIQINLSYNLLATLPIELFALKKLQHIDASHNQVSHAFTNA